MLVERLHTEDIKAAIRKEYGSIKAFQEQKGLPSTAVSDLFRGRTSTPTKIAVEEVVQEVFRKSIISDNSPNRQGPHRLNAEVR